MEISTGPINIEKLFETNKNVEVPNFQRNYVWQKGNVEQLLLDAIQAEELGDSHFFGPIVLLRRGENFEIIDGQQRITTAVMALCILRDFLFDVRYFPPNEEIFVGHYKHLLQNTLFSTTDGLSPKFRAGYLIREFFDSAVLPAPPIRTVTVTKRGAGLGPAEVNDTKELRKVYRVIEDFFRERFSPLEISERKKLLTVIFHGLTKSFQIHSMVVEDDFEAYRLFESINYLGIKLEPGDLLKSLTLRKIQKGDPGSLGSALEDWDRFIENLGGYNVSKFLRHYLLSTTKPKVQASKIFPVFKSKLEGEPEAAKNTLKELLEASENYGLLLGHQTIPEKSTQIHEISRRLNYLGDTHRVLLLMILNSPLSSEDQARAFRAAEYLVFRNVCSRENRQKTEDLYRLLGQSLQVAAISEHGSVSDWCRDVISRAVDDGYLRNFIVNNTDRIGIQFDPREDLARYVLAVLTDDIDDFVVTAPTLEHLAPQKPAADSNWKKLVHSADDIYNLQIHWWGNLTWLEKSLNSQIQNKEWDQKLVGNPENNVDGLNKSKFLVTKSVCTKKAWGTEQIISRGNWMLETLLELRSADWVISGTNKAKQVELW